MEQFTPPTPINQQVPGTVTPNDFAGLPASPEDANVSTRSFLTAYLLSQFLGVVGADRFYLGYKNKGFLKLFTLGGFGVWWVLDQILLISNRLRPNDNSQFDDYQSYRLLAVMIFVMAWTFFVAAAWYGIANTIGSKPPIPVKNDAGTSHIPPARQAAGTTVFGQTAQGSGMADGITVKVIGVVPNPKTAGDAPSLNTQYLEVDLGITNNARHDSIVPGTFYYRTVGNKLLSTADSVGNSAKFANKNVQVVGKESIDGLSLAPGHSGSGYIIFQIPRGDNGKLLWLNGYYDEHGTILAIFDLR